jgi:hypothetical protein
VRFGQMPMFGSVLYPKKSARGTSRPETPHFPERAFRPISTLGA